MASKPTLFFTWPCTLLPLFLFLFPLLIESRPIPQAPHQAFQFIKKLEGSQKGQTIIGLHHLKQYLEKFGYLPHHSNTATKPIYDDDSFDDLLESAIKSYQHNFHLNITGKIDAATAEQMMIPRCGVPDIVNGKSGKGRHLGSTQLHQVSHYAFFQNEPKWPPSKTQLTYGFYPGNLVFDIQTLRSICANAFSKWQAVTHFTFQEIEDVNNADLKIGFFSGDHGDGVPFDGRGGTLGHSFEPTVGWTHFDSDERWAMNPPSPEFFDIESVAVHEFGHLLGLAHSSDPNAIMFPSLRGGQRKVTLSEDDIQGIRFLYVL
ncbi:hypothetical protein AAC387_Pa10g1315 [Persea americana]